VSTLAVALTAAKYAGATKAVITVEGGEIRCRWDGTAPTAAEGHYVYVGDEIRLMTAADIANFKAIRATTTDATIRVNYCA
jgi:hypothetical protein